MDIPKSLKIGPYIYTLKEATEPIILNGVQCSALIDCESLEIFYERLTDEQKTIQGIYHEVVHGIEDGKFLSYEMMDKEDITDRLSIGILEFIWDNEDFIKHTLNIRKN